MDIIVKTVLNFIQKQKGFEHSVVAGGAVRDHYLDLEPRDYDILLPYSKTSRFNLLDKVRKEFLGDVKEKGQDYGNGPIRGVNEFTFEGHTFDLIFRDEENNDDFGDKVIETFDYGINMAYYDGLTFGDTNEKFQNDFRARNMTLWRMDGDLSDGLLKAINRYNAINEKHKNTHGYNLRFINKCLTRVIKLVDDKPKYYVKKAPIEDWRIPDPAPAPRAADLRAAQRDFEERMQENVNRVQREADNAWDQAINPVGEIPLPAEPGVGLRGWVGGARGGGMAQGNNPFDFDARLNQGNIQGQFVEPAPRADVVEEVQPVAWEDMFPAEGQRGAD